MKSSMALSPGEAFNLDGTTPNLSRLTVVILSRNRPEFLRATVAFWLQTGVKLIVMDGSDQRDVTLGAWDNLDYFHAVSSSTERLRLAAQRVRTEYVVQCCDDELYSPSALQGCLKFLDKNLDYVSCGGRTLALHMGPFGGYWTEKYPLLRSLDLTSDDSNSRISRHLSSYTPAVIYSVVRSSVWSKLWTQISTQRFTPVEIFEMQFEYLAASIGKVKVLPMLYWVRNKFVTPVRDKEDSGWDAVPKMEQWWVDPRFSDEKDRFISHMAGITSEIAEEMVVVPGETKDLALRISSHFSDFASVMFHNSEKRHKSRLLLGLKRRMEKLLGIVFSAWPFRLLEKFYVGVLLRSLKGYSGREMRLIKETLVSAYR